jgi:CBS domain-containing protein
MVPNARARHSPLQAFLELSPADQVAVLRQLPREERLTRVRLLPLDDAADLVQATPPDEREGLLGLLDEAARREVTALMAYSEDVAGGLMNPRFVRLRPDLTIDEAISYLRKQAPDVNVPIAQGYVLDPDQRLLGVISTLTLFSSPAGQIVRDLMNADPIVVTDETDQEAVGQLFREHGLFAVPVVDSVGRMKGVVTVDDIVEVLDEEATEDMHKTGGVAALETPYLDATFHAMLRKRGGWLTLLFLGEMLTATAMGWFEEQHTITRRDRFQDVVDGLEAAREAGLVPVKINAVLLRGVNDDQAPELLRWSIDNGYDLRFIEQMPLDAQHGWSRAEMVTADEIFAHLEREFALTPVDEPRGSAPAELFHVDGGPATVGVIASVTRPFCGDCDRVRLTADGQVRNCLFAREESDLRAALRAGASDDELAERWVVAMRGKRAGHGIDDPTFLQPDRPMSAIGG